MAPSTNKVYTDGACSGNPGPGGWGLVYLQKNHVVELGGAEGPRTTNNRMEIQAAIEALKLHQSKSDQTALLDFYTDSTLLINACTKWLKNWKKNNWVKADGKEVANKDLWKLVDSLLDEKAVHFHHVRGHTGDKHNERADDIAVAFSKHASLELYDGPASSYDQFLEKFLVEPAFKEQCSVPPPSKKHKFVEGGAAPANLENLLYPCYVSFVNGVFQSFQTWPECEKSVKGVSGVKYKKIKNKKELQAFLASL